MVGKKDLLISLGALGVSKLADHINSKLSDKVDSFDRLQGDRSLKSGIIKKANLETGGRVVQDVSPERVKELVGLDIPGYSPFFVAPNSIMASGKIRELYDKELEKKLGKKKFRENKKLIDYMVSGNSVVSPSGNDLDPDTLAHELGHGRHFRGESKSGLGKFLHKSPVMMSTKGVSALSKINSLRSGISSGLGKEGKFGKGTAYGFPILSNASVLGREYAASKEGLKILKEEGASKEQIDRYKRRMKADFGTYLSYGISDLAENIALRHSSKALASNYKKYVVKK